MFSRARQEGSSSHCSHSIMVEIDEAQDEG